jgi:predicted dehydrogenase
VYVLIVGLGSIGRRHLANLRAIEPSAYITVLRHQVSAEKVALADRVVYQLDDVLDALPDIALITNPAPFHIEIALLLAYHNVHLFIEKPLADGLKRVDELLAFCDESNLTLMVGYNLRFSEPLRLVKRALDEGMIGRVLSVRAEAGGYLPNWRPDVDYRQTVSARRDLGGGVLMEASHEFDYVRWLAGEVRTVSAQVGKLSDLEIDVEDLAEVTLHFANGAIGNVHLNMVQQPRSRTCRIIGTEGTITWDAVTNQAQVYTTKTQAWADLHPATTLDRNTMYVEELTHFLECVDGQHTPAVSGEDGKRALAIALAARQSSEEGRVVVL